MPTKFKSIRPIILSGGTGSRLWPLSRSAYPKHLGPLLGEESLLQKTLGRLKNLPILDPIIVCNQDHRFLVAEQLREIKINPKEIILEPCGRNTAPAIAIAAMACDPEEILLVLPADHLIGNEKNFTEAVISGIELALQGYVITFGVVPDSPHTGYGYIQRGDGLDAGFKINKFVEKPDLSSAKNYLDSGEYYWNSGMFLFQAKSYLKELKKGSEDIFNQTELAYSKIKQERDYSWLDKNTFEKIRSDSIDYAVMEKTKLGVVIPMNANWSDVGSWDALYDVTPKDENQNVLIGDVVSIDTERCYIRGAHHLIATVGVKDHFIIDTPDAVLVLHKDYSQKVKNLVEILGKKGRLEIQRNAPV